MQGFGNVGSNAARLMFEAGYKIIGIVEFDGGLSNPDGIDVDALWEHRYRTGSIHGFPGAEAMDPQQLFVSDCDILVPAAIENVITSRNADRVKCKILCEGANGPTTAAADEILALTPKWFWANSNLSGLALLRGHFTGAGFSVDDVTVTEGQAGTVQATFTVTRFVFTQSSEK